MKNKKLLKGSLSVITALALTLSAAGTGTLVFDRGTVSLAADDAAVRLKIEPEARSVFNDTDGDGWGEFQGWGTSLCWWANRVGYDEELTSQAAKYFYNTEEGLGMTIGRYNIGGGDAPGHDHIQRSDSIVPGYAKDITKISSEDEAEGFDQYDLECGYAWNYDWEADANQLNVLRAAMEEAGSDFIAEAFSNSPPYFMTNSGCSSGGESGKSNLRTDSYHAFAKYLTDVTKHLLDEGFPIQSLEGMNEPNSNWAANSAKQEGCVVYPGEEQSNVILALQQQAEEAGLTDLVYAGTDESGTGTAWNSYNALTQEAKDVLNRIDTHTYSVSKPTDLRTLAMSENKDLWMSEMDGTTKGGEDAGEMTGALGLGNNISSQLNSLLPSAWIMWDAVDIHVDANNKFDRDTFDETERQSLDSNGFWGIAVADHNEKKILLTKKYYAYGQYSRYIRPGYTLLSTAGDNIAAYDKNTDTFVLVAANNSAQDTTYSVDLSRFGDISSDAQLQVIRTSGALSDGENWADISEEGTASVDLENKKITADVKGNSITTYVLTGVCAPEDRVVKKAEIPVELPADSILTEQLEKLIDGKFENGYSYMKKMSELIVDLGQEITFDMIGFAAYANNTIEYIENGSVYTSRDGETWTKISDIGRKISPYNYSYIYREEILDESAASCRYIKFINDGTNPCSLGEVAVFTAGELPEETPDGSSTAAPDGSSTAAPDGSSTAAPDGNSTAAPDGSSTAAPDGSSTAAPDGSSTAAPDGSSTAAPTETPDDPAGSDQKLSVKKVTKVKVNAAAKKLSVSWKKQSGAKYKVAYSLNKKKLSALKNGKVKAKGVTVVSASKNKITLKKLKAKKKYYIKICAYKKKNGKTVYGNWSSAVSRKTK